MSKRTIGLLVCLAVGVAAALIGYLYRDAVVLYEEGDRLTITHGLSIIWAPIVIGLVICAAGLIELVAGSGKGKRAGVVAFLVGALTAGVVALVLPYERVTVDPQSLQITGGFLGKGTARSISLERLTSIGVSQSMRSKRQGKRRRRRLATIVRFVPREGQPIEVLMGGSLREPALKHLLRQARERGIVVDDQR